MNFSRDELLDEASRRILARHAALPAAEQGQAVSVPSPCNSVCRMDQATGLCLGCLREIGEIAAWGNWGDAQRRAAWDLLATRARRLRAEAGA